MIVPGSQLVKVSVKRDQDKNLSNDRKKRKKFFNRASAYYFQYSLVSENQMKKMFKTDETKRGKYNVNG